MYKCFLKSYKIEFKSYILNHKSILNSTKIFINTNQLYHNTSNIIWEDDNQEILYNHQLYDVVEIIIVNNKAQITIVSDEKEQALKNQFTEVYDHESINKQNNPISLLKQFLALKCIVSNVDIQKNIKSVSINNINLPYHGNTSKGYLNQETQPPNFS